MRRASVPPWLVRGVVAIAQRLASRKPIPRRSPIAPRRAFARCRRSPIGSPRRRARCSAICAGSRSIARSSRPEVAKTETRAGARHRRARRGRRRGSRRSKRRASRRRPASRSGSSSSRSAAAAATCSCCWRRTTCGRSGAWRAAWPRSPSSIACGSKRIGARWPPSATRSTTSISNATRSTRCRKKRPRARAAVDAAVAARNRVIDDLDRRRDLAAQFVAELQQAQLQLERTLATADAASPVVALPIRPFRGDLPWPVDGQGRVAIRPRARRPFRDRRSSEMASRCRRPKARPATAVHEGTVAYAAPFSGFGTLVIVDHGGSAFTLYGHLLGGVRERRDERQPRRGARAGRAGAVRRSRLVFRAAHRRAPG